MKKSWLTNTPNENTWKWERATNILMILATTAFVALLVASSIGTFWAEYTSVWDIIGIASLIVAILGTIVAAICAHVGAGVTLADIFNSNLNPEDYIW